MFQKFSLIIIFGLFFTSCKKEEIDLSSVDYITITSLVPQVYLGSGNSLELKPKAYDSLGRSLYRSGWKFYADGEKITSRFYPDQDGLYNVWVELGELTSDTLQIQAVGEKKYDLFTFKMIIHVVNLPDLDFELIYESYEHANKACSNNLGSESPNAQSPAFYFELAEVDPFGKALEHHGIIVEQDIPPDIKLRELQEIKKLRQWNPDQYINVWISDVHPNAWANLPFLDEYHSIAELDTIPEEQKSVLSMVNIMPEQLGGDNNTLTHELGHFFGLYHLFTTSCLYDADYCSDTPKYVHPGKNDLPYESCNGWNFYRDNHMDYTNEPTFTFTYQQVERMRYVLKYGRYVGNRRGLEYQPF